VIRGRGWITTGVALLATVALTALILGVAGYDPVRALGALVQGSVGSVGVLQNITLVRAVPLILTGLAVALAFRAGLWNIGAEGQLYAGATASVAVALALPDGLPSILSIPAILAGGAAAGVVWASVPVFLKLRAGVGEVITTLLMNFVAINLSAWLVHGPMQEARKVFPQSDAIGEAARLPILIPGSRLHLGFAIAIVLAVLLWGWLRFTSGGFVVRALGANPDAARVAGRVNDRKMIVRVFLVSGALAGLAGAVEITGVTFRMYEGISPDYGYTAIAVALLAGLNPLAVIFTGALFGALEGGAGAMQRVADVPAGWVSTVVAITILTILAADRLLRRRADG
jgi:simple sugar transport system permease protein